MFQDAALIPLLLFVPLLTGAGEAADTDILKLSQVESASVIVVCVPDDEAVSRIVQNLRTVNSSCQVLVRCRYQMNRSQLRKSGANHMVSEEAETGNALVNTLADFDKNTGNGIRQSTIVIDRVRNGHQ